MDGPPHAQHDRAPMVRQDGLVALIEEHVVVVHGIARADLRDVPSHLCPLPLVGVKEHLHLGPDGQDGVLCGVLFKVDHEVVSMFIVDGGGLCQRTIVPTSAIRTAERTAEREGRLFLHPGSLAASSASFAAFSSAAAFISASFLARSSASLNC